MSSACPFCSITSKKAPASIVYEDPNVLAFMDLNPANVGHTLVVPRKHWENIYEVPEKILAEMAAVAKRVSVAVKKTVNADGISIIQLNGESAGQVVMHIHIHVIPRFDDDPISRTLRSSTAHHGPRKQERKNLDEIAQRIRENL